MGTGIQLASLYRWRILLASTLLGVVVVIAMSLGIGYFLSAYYGYSNATSFLSMAPGGVAPYCSCEQRKALAAKLHGRPDYPIMVAVRILTMWAKRYVKSGNVERAYKIVNMIVTLESSTGAARERLSVWAAERFMNGKKAKQHN